MKNLILHELQQFLYELRLPITLSIVLVMFAISSLTYIGEYDQAVKSYREIVAGQEQQLRDRAGLSATNVVIHRREYRLPPRNNGFISDCGEPNMPNTLEYTAFHWLRFSGNVSSDNPLVMPSERISWGFILTVLFSFLAIIFSFDAVSGEKEGRTLALSLSNPVKRSRILLGKFIAINILLIACALAGILLALLILMLSPAVNITGETFSEIGLFLLFVVFFTGSMSAVGLLASVMCANSNISLLVSVSLWLVFLIAIPNFSQTLGTIAWPVERGNMVMFKIWEKRKEIEATFPDGKWMSNGSNPFLPQHEIRANMQMAFGKNEAQFWDEHYAAQFRQVKNTRRWAWISPLAVFEYGTEALLDGGYLRLKGNYTDLQNFKIQYLQWFKDVDAKDDKSPHWYNPYEDYSTTRKPVAYEEIPQYAEHPASIAERLAETLKYLMVMLAYMGVMFVLAIIRFERYDVR
ncbi:MAG: ABC transporter permease [Dysgonamonadaceae bacterium]|jgi:ABC-type transport system involved in multi-copper enzyme maturation permease subunit|nr:ABC transporter permease [Dysgonamonadaceae bacterium]